MKTVLFAIETSGPGGAEKMLISLVEALDKSRFKPLVCLLKTGWLHDQLVSRGYEVLLEPLGRTPDFGWIRRMERRLRDRKVDVMHAHEYYMNVYCAMLSSRTGIPALATVHGKNYFGDTWLRRALYRWAARHSRMIAVSEGIRDYLVSRIAIPERQLLTVRNGIDTQPFAAAAGMRSAARAELGLDDQQFVIGCLGNLYPVKGHTHLIAAAAEICARHPRTIFLFAGRGQMLESLQQQAQGLGLADNMRFLGFREDTPRLLAAMDIFALPSLSEGLPLSLLEAMAARRAIVASAVGGIPEVIHEGQTGMLVEPGDVPGLSRAILRLLDDPALRERTAERGQQHVVQNFNIDAMRNVYQNLYDGRAA